MGVAVNMRTACEVPGVGHEGMSYKFIRGDGSEGSAYCNARPDPHDLQYNLDGSVEYRSPFDEPVCFVAGTLVHARHGLVPIEQLKVGDFVLSKSDTGEGSKEYKRVTKTFARESEEVFLVVYYVEDEDIFRSLVVTSEHPFWVDRVGWTAARNLGAGDDLVVHRDSGADEFATVFSVQIVWDTEVPDVGWCGGTRDSDGLERGEGPTVDLRNGGVSVTQPEDYAWNHDAVALAEPLRRQVFNIEVEDFHTYYVGEAGVWVHNACPPRIEGTAESRGVTTNNPAETAAGLAPDPRATVYNYTAASELASRLAEQRGVVLVERNLNQKPDAKALADSQTGTMRTRDLSEVETAQVKGSGLALPYRPR